MEQSTPKIAICFYGQPRNYEEGYQVFYNFLKGNQIDISTTDFFFHAWTISPTEQFHTSPYRKISPSELQFNPNMKSQLLDLYKPKRHRFEPQKSRDFFHVEQYQNTIAYRNLNDKKTIDNISNVLSQLYSIQSVRDLFQEYILETGVKYDFIIISRFDFKGNLSLIKINNYDYRTSVLLPENHHPRNLISGSVIFLPQSVFLTWMNMYQDLDKILDNSEIAEIMLKNEEKLYFNAEEIFTASYLYYYKDAKHILYLKPAIWFTTNL